MIQELVNTDFQDDLKVGNTLDIPRLSNLTTQTKTAGISNTIDFGGLVARELPLAA